MGASRSSVFSGYVLIDEIAHQVAKFDRLEYTQIDVSICTRKTENKLITYVRYNLNVYYNKILIFILIKTIQIRK